jgi:hypothetical protein
MTSDEYLTKTNRWRNVHYTGAPTTSDYLKQMNPLYDVDSLYSWNRMKRSLDEFTNNINNGRKGADIAPDDLAAVFPLLFKRSLRGEIGHVTFAMRMNSTKAIGGALHKYIVPAFYQWFKNSEGQGFPKILDFGDKEGNRVGMTEVDIIQGAEYREYWKSFRDQGALFYGHEDNPTFFALAKRDPEGRIQELHNLQKTESAASKLYLKKPTIIKPKGGPIHL